MGDIGYTWIDDTVCKFEAYGYNGDSNYELGFRRHSGMVYRVINKSVEEWLDTEHNVNHGRVCIMTCTDDLNNLRANSDDSTCLYAEGLDTNSESKADLLVCRMPKLSNVDLGCDKTRSNIMLRILMAFHIAAYNKTDTVIIDNIGTDITEGFDWFVDMIKDTCQMYKYYLCNVFYLISDANKYELCI